MQALHNLNLAEVIMKIKTLCVLPIILLMLLEVQCAYANIDKSDSKALQPLAPINTYSQIDLSTIDSQTLVVIDIDDTTLRGTNAESTVKWYEHMHKEYLQECKCSNEQAHKDIYPNWIKAQGGMNIELVDPEIVTFLNQVRAQGGQIIFLSARHKEIAKITLRQFKYLGIDPTAFSSFTLQKFSKEYAKAGKLSKQALLVNGILFANDSNNLGEVLADFIKEAKIDVSRLICIDDSSKHLGELATASAKLEIPYSPYLMYKNYEVDYTNPNSAVLRDPIL
jgi:predicted secreted acid phosphatase